MNGNLFDRLPTGTLQAERIVSNGQSSPPGFWYDQPDDEWVALLSGSAVLRFADEDVPRVLRPGDWIFIAAHRHHRVASTDADVASVWLAVHLGPPD